MTETARTAWIPSGNTEFNAFLYAGIGAEANGTVLSVLSAMARMNLDPWRESATLAGLPVKTAVKRLAALLAALPGRLTTPDERDSIAERLVKLLPQRGHASPPPPQKGRAVIPPHLLGVAAMLSSKAAIYVVIAMIALVVGAGWFVAAKAPANDPRSAVSETTARPDVPLRH